MRAHQPHWIARWRVLFVGALLKLERRRRWRSKRCLLVGLVPPAHSVLNEPSLVIQCLVVCLDRPLFQGTDRDWSGVNFNDSLVVFFTATIAKLVRLLRHGRGELKALIHVRVASNA